jgi:hypothetical protein
VIRQIAEDLAALVSIALFVAMLLNWAAIVEKIGA